LAKIGTFFYDISLRLNSLVNWSRKILRLDYWSLSKYLKTKAKQKFKTLDNYDYRISKYGESLGYSSVCVGHTHIPEKKEIENILYLNTGDMCETGSFIIEHLDGELELITLERK
jgi:UDP-2,3-diacylglucosamine pyrophosphatase LpxH